MDKITFIGAGAIGKSISSLIPNDKYEIAFWDKDEAKLPSHITLESSVKDAKLIFLCVPSWSVRDVLFSLHHLDIKKTYIASLSKGIEEGSGMTMDEVIEEVLPTSPYCILGGALLASEIEKGREAYGVLGTTNHELYAYIKKVFEDSHLRLEGPMNPHSVALSGMLKNIYAIAIGMAEALELGYNTMGYIVAKTVEEMRIIFDEMDCDERAILSCAGIADLIATGFSPDSKNHQLGEDIAQGVVHTHKREGVVAINALSKSLKHNHRLRIFNALVKTIEQKLPAHDFIELI